MLPTNRGFEFDHCGTKIVYGRECLRTLGDTLEPMDVDRALVVTGPNVATNRALIEYLSSSLPDVDVEIFHSTASKKSIQVVSEGVAAVDAHNPDVLIGLGGGSSLDTARQISVFAATDRSLTKIRNAALDGVLGAINPDQAQLPVMIVPTTFAGAALSEGGSIEIVSAEESPDNEPIRVSGTSKPVAIYNDPAVFETTPVGAIAGSAMNGFNKGIETLYTRKSTSITDSTALHGTQLLHQSLPEFPGDSETMENAVVGSILVQYKRRTSVLHAYGHGFSRRYPVQQGVIHGVVAPAVLRDIFSSVDGRRELVATGLGIDPDGLSHRELASEIVQAVEDVRTAMDVPTSLRELDGVERADFRDVATAIHEDGPMRRAPAGYNPTVDEIVDVLNEAW